MKMGVTYFAVFLSALAFSVIWQRFVRPKNMVTALMFGAWFGLGRGVSFGYGSYAVMPIPYMMALVWFLGTLVEYAVAGLIVATMVKE